MSDYSTGGTERQEEYFVVSDGEGWRCGCIEEDGSYKVTDELQASIEEADDSERWYLVFQTLMAVLMEVRQSSLRASAQSSAEDLLVEEELADIVGFVEGSFKNNNEG
ncbi:hypothetical protein HDV00_007765 [Rhizophlyctis rosea]|nr:hypothetical protein HDV00_007765 [Rhizophlyctis rosea]